MKARIDNINDKIEVTIKDDEIIIEGLELKPYWKRMILMLCWWKNPTYVIRKPKINYNRVSKGELIALFG